MKCYAGTKKIGSRLKKKIPILADSIIRKRYYRLADGSKTITVEISEKDLIEFYEYTQG